MSCLLLFFFFKQKTAYEMRISDWSSDVCSSDLLAHPARILAFGHGEFEIEALAVGAHRQAGAVRKRDRAFLGREHDRHLVAPVLGELLEIAAGRYRRHAGDRKRTRLNSSH